MGRGIDQPAPHKQSIVRASQGPRPLTDQQLLAIDMLVQGGRPKEVYEAVGISRTELWRWCTKSPAFIAERSRQRAVMREALGDQFLGLVGGALRVSAESIREGDPDMARDVLRIAARVLTEAASSGSSVEPVEIERLDAEDEVEDPPAVLLLPAPEDPEMPASNF
jgi:hypothetical protein